MEYKRFIRFVTRNFEAWIWLGALISIAFLSPESTQTTLCVWHHLGVESCPGCGLGHSMSAAFNGQFLKSWELHPLGMAAIVILTFRIAKIFIEYRQFVLFNSKENA